VLDDQVHFREPGLTHKGDIESESGQRLLGITSTLNNPTRFLMLLQEILEEKYQLAAENLMLLLHL
jgi:dihydroorotase